MTIEWIEGDYHTDTLRHAAKNPRDTAEVKANFKAGLEQRQQIAGEVSKPQWVLRVTMPDGRDLYACPPPKYAYNDMARNWREEFTADLSKALRFNFSDFEEGRPLGEARITLPACLGCLVEMMLVGAVGIHMERVED